MKLEGIKCDKYTENWENKQLTDFDAIALTCNLQRKGHVMLIFKDMDDKYWLYTEGKQYKIKDSFKLSKDIKITDMVDGYSVNNVAI